MRRRYILVSLVVMGLLLPRLSSAAYDLSWWTVDGGGGQSSGGVYTLSGTVGQADAGALSGGNYTIAGGFWVMTADITVKNGTASVPNGGWMALYCIQSCTTTGPVTFTIENAGDAVLNLTGSPIVAMSGDTGNFTLDASATAATVAAGGGTTTFTLTFTNPGDDVPRLVTLTIANDDSDESPYTFKVVGNPAFLLWTK